MTIVVRSHQILIHAPLQSVFEYVSDLTRHPEWSAGKLSVEEVTPGPVTIGKEYFSRGEVVMQKDRPNKVRVSEYEPPYKFGFIASDRDAGNVSHIFTCIEQNGGILVTRTMTLSLNPIVAFLFQLFIYPWIGGPSMDQSLAALKTTLEGNQRN